MPRGATFVGPTTQQMVSHPSPSAFGDSHPGPILGVMMDNNKPFRLNPWWLMHNNIINAMTFLVIAAIKQGKSAMIKMLILRLMRLAPGGRMPYVQIHDYRPEGESTEYAKLADYLGCTVTFMKDMQFNILDPRLYQNKKGEVSRFSLIEMILRIAEFEKQPLSDMEMLALRITMSEMTEVDPLLWDFPYIARTGGGITAEMYAKFRAQDEQRLLKELEARLSGVDSTALRQTVHAQHARIMSLPDNTSLVDAQTAGVELRNRIESVTDGIARGIFGTRHSYYDLMVQPLSVQDWRGVPPAAERLLKTVGGRLQITAIENDRRDLIPDIMVDDELHRAMQNLQYVKDRVYRQQITRSLGTAEFAGTHSEDSVRPGDEGSDSYRLSGTLLHNTGVVIHGKLPNDSHILNQAKTRSSLTDTEVATLKRLPIHCFGVKYNPEAPLIVFRATPFGRDFDLIDTESATRSKAQDNKLTDPNARREFARRHGATYVGN